MQSKKNKGLLSKLPPPANKKTGWPWTVETPLPEYDPDHVYPKISIITPSYNQGEFIEQTIRSVLLQNYPNLEYIILDGGSTDQTIEILKKYTPWISWISEKDEGQADAINKGLLKCTGQVFNWINSDDWYEPGALKRIGEVFGVPDIQIYAGRERMVSEAGKELSIHPGTPLGKDIQETLIYSQINQPATFVRMALLQQTAFLRKDLLYLFDAEWWLRLVMLAGRDAVYKDKLIIDNFRLHEDSKTMNYGLEFYREKRILLYALYFYFYKKTEANFTLNLSEEEKKLAKRIQESWKSLPSTTFNKKYVNVFYEEAFFHAFVHYDYDLCRALISKNPKLLLSSRRWVKKIIVLFPRGIVKFLRKTWNKIIYNK